MEESIKLTIQKLLALAKDATDEESHSAMLKARKLMLKYSIKESDLLSVRNIDKTVVNEKVYRNKLLWWHRKLAQITANHFRCSFYQSKVNTYQWEVRFVGLENDVEIATMVFNFARVSIHYHSKMFLLRPEIKRKWKRKHQFKNDYIEGYLSGLDKKFQEQTVSESLELVVIQDVLVVEYFNSLTLSTESISTPPRANDNSAWLSGFKDGKRFEQGREMIES